MKTQIVTVDADYIKRTLFYYCELSAQLASTKIAVEKQNLLIEALTLTAIKDKKILKQNLQVFAKKFRENKELIKKAVIPLLSGNHPSDLHRLQSYMTVVEGKIRQQRKAIDDMHNEVMKRNNENMEVLKFSGKAASTVKFVANSGATVIGVFVSPAHAWKAFGVTMSGALAGEAIEYTNDPNKATVVTWKGSGKVIIDQTRSKGLEAVAKKGGYEINKTAGRFLAKPAAMLSLFFNWETYQKDMEKFE